MEVKPGMMPVGGPPFGSSGLAGLRRWSEAMIALPSASWSVLASYLR